MSTPSSRKTAITPVHNSPRDGAGPTDDGGDPQQQVREPEALDPTQQVWMARTTLLILNLLLLLGNLIHLFVDEPHEPSHPIFSRPAWNGDYDESHIEILGHVQLVAATIMLLFLWITRHAAVYGVWALVILAITVDDLLQIHERGGAVLVSALGLPAVAGLWPQDLGELLVWAAMAFVLGIVLVIGHLRAPRYAGGDFWLLAGLVAFLAMFGVGVDQLHVIVEPHVPPLAGTALALLETSAELVFMTLIVLAVHQMAIQPKMPLRSAPRHPGNLSR